MYNDEKNLYHYTYRKDGSESTHARRASPPWMITMHRG